MKKLIAIIALITIALSVGNIVKAEDFNREHALIIQKSEQPLLNGNVGPHLINNSHIDNISFQIQTPQFYSLSPTFSPFVFPGDKLMGPSQGSWWCGVRDLRSTRVWMDGRHTPSSLRPGVIADGKIRICNKDKELPIIHYGTVNYTLRNCIRTICEEGWIHVIPSVWSIKKNYNQPEESLLLSYTDTQDNIKYTVEIKEGTGRVGNLIKEHAGTIILNAERVNNI